MGRTEYGNPWDYKKIKKFSENYFSNIKSKCKGSISNSMQVDI